MRARVWRYCSGCPRNSVVIIPSPQPISSFCRKPSEIPRSSSQRPEVGLVTIYNGPTSRKYCKYQVKRLFWRYCSRCRHHALLPPTHPKSKSKIRSSSLQTRQVDFEAHKMILHDESAVNTEQNGCCLNMAKSKCSWLQQQQLLLLLLLSLFYYY